ncbi:hypothetical protein Scep_023935 [Stephania cephalantha]|uniref:Uncharacterized protein n=1 Tax=Stephania cephalantha TaxID=152367 RepID=A0AAP0EYD4_9MAGN
MKMEDFFFIFLFCLCGRRLHVVVFLGMARLKAPMTRKEVGIEVSRGNRGRGGRRPPTASYRKEKEQDKVDLKGKGKIGGRRAKKLELHDEGSNIDAQRHSDLVVAQGEDEAHASESSSSDSSAPANTTSSDRHVGGSTSGGGAHNEGDSRGQREMCAPFPGGPEDGSLLKSFKDHVALVIWSNEVHTFLLVWSSLKFRVFNKLTECFLLLQDRPTLKCINHGAQIQEWDLQSCHTDTAGL